MLLLPGQREDEVADMRWSDVDLVQGVCTLPREASNSGWLNQVPLPTLARQILEQLPKADSDLLFSIRATTPSTDCSVTEFQRLS